jgi:winged helix domain-containing protein/ATPase family protein associated with various cellular activities (AAA)
VSADAWHERNARHLSAALAWLRLRLDLYAVAHQGDPPPAASAPTAAPSPTTAAPRRRWFGRHADAAPAPARPRAKALPAASVASVKAQADEAAAALAAIEAEEGDPPALVALAERLGLSRFERDVLLLCAAMELDTRIADLCAGVQGPDLPHPTFALALALFDDPAWEVVSPERPLRYWRLLEINQPGGRPLTMSALRADERIVNYLKGLNYLDDRLTLLLTPLEAPAGTALPPSQLVLVDAICARLAGAESGGLAPVVNLLGPDSPSKQLVARQAAAALGLDLARLPVGLLPEHVGELETLARLWQRETALLPIALYLDAHELDGGAQAERGAPPVARFLARSDGVLFLASADQWPGLVRPAMPIDASRPTPAEQERAWEAELGDRAGSKPRALAGQFDLNLIEIHAIAAAALRGDPPDLQERLWQACLLATRPRLETLAVRLRTTPTWDDLVLRADDLAVLHAIADQVRQRPTVYDEWGFRDRMDRGLGVSALFAGDSGTGKTMAAGVIANDLGLDLYHIDLSAVVSKYIGETEKNLRRLFDAADAGGAILFFDEADALFGKRSEVKDSHDRYANIEINYLLQRMEAYHGLAILATNMKTALDRAFMRRLRFVVDFQFPGAPERRAIWEGVFPARTPLEGLDAERLARLVLTGGSIHSIALNAAFLAAQEGGPVTMALILRAARAELRKLDRPFSEADFRWEPAAAPA